MPTGSPCFIHHSVGCAAPHAGLCKCWHGHKSQFTSCHVNITICCSGCLVRWAAFKERVFSSGIEPSLRQLAWKFLLGVYPPDSTRLEREALLSKKNREYERMRSQWQTMNEEQASRSERQLHCMHGKFWTMKQFTMHILDNQTVLNAQALSPRLHCL